MRCTCKKGGRRSFVQIFEAGAAGELILIKHTPGREKKRLRCNLKFEFFS